MPRSIVTNRWGRLGLAIAGLIAFLILWEALPRLGLVREILLPPPSALPAAFWREISSGALIESIGNSFAHYLLGLAIGSALGIAIGVAVGLSKTLEAATSWIVRVLRPIPGLAWVPFALIWFGATREAATFIVAIGVFWLNFFAALAAVQAIDRGWLEVADAFGHRGFGAKLVKIILPGAAEGILSGFRAGLGQAWMSVVAAELFGVAGVGQRMTQASSLLATDLVLVYMLTIALLYGVTESLFLVARSRILAWKP